ncbi:MAG: DUF6575 domain-containing protein, partial [Sphaerospermopsis kisseleviana]
VSSSRFQSVIKGDVELRHIFAETEDAFVYQVEIPYEDEINVIVKNIECNQIPDDYLPELGQFIQSEFQNIENIEVVSTQKRREILDFVLKFPDKDIQEAPVGDLGLILSSLQETIDAIGQIKSGKSESHIIPFPVRSSKRLKLSCVFSGSFGIRLEGTVYEEDSLGLGESFLGQCFKEFIQLINLGANSEELPAKLNILKKKTAFKYTEFLIALTRIGISKLHINWASPGQKVQVGEIEQETISKVIDVINNTIRAETEICVKVKLTQINYNTRTTTLQEVGSRKKYKCSIADSAIKDVKSIEEDSVYVATIQEYAIVSTVLNKEKHEYELLSLKLEAESENTQA